VTSVPTLKAIQFISQTPNNIFFSESSLLSRSDKTFECNGAPDIAGVDGNPAKAGHVELGANMLATGGIVTGQAETAEQTRWANAHAVNAAGRDADGAAD
jgi:hypothetical protein